jgi:hypothetical protein
MGEESASFLEKRSVLFRQKKNVFFNGLGHGTASAPGRNG